MNEKKTAEEGWHAAPKKQKPLKDKLQSISNKIHDAQFAVRNESGEVIGFVRFELYHRIRLQETAALREENERLKEALKELIPLTEEMALGFRLEEREIKVIENAKKLTT